ncbi:MAG TPA: hypothetical protein VN289_00455, partial [Paraburkholderia sp.]|nr:hypothetical protein [Paraburkholderia sp.]
MSYGIVSRIVTVGAILMLAGCGGGGGGSSSSPGSPSASSSQPALANATALVDGTKVGDDYWSAGSTQSGGTGQPVSGLNCGTRGNLYTYSHLSIYLNGRPLALPTEIGTVGPTMAAQTGCAYPVHTDDESGKIRMDASTGASYTLGQFFSVWGQPLTASNVAGLTGMPITIYVNNGGQLSK